GFTIDSSSADEYLSRLAALPDVDLPNTRQTELARRYAHTLFVRRPWAPPGLQFMFVERDAGWSPTDVNVTRAPSISDPIGDLLEDWSKWAATSTSADYLVEKGR